MICKNCANIFSDDLTECPECGTPIKLSAVKETEPDSQEEIEKLVSLAFSDTAKELPEPQEFEDIFSYSEDQLSENETPEVAEGEAQTEAEEPTEADVESEPEEKIKAKPKKVKLQKMTKKEKGAFNFILSLTVVIFIGIIALAGIRMGTDVFEKDKDDVKAIALSGLTATETEELEEYLSKISIVAYNGFNREKDVIVDLMAYLRPHDAGGLYNRFFAPAEITANTPDPNGRFKNENGDYSYYVLEAEKVDSILASLGYSVNHNVNEKNFYCYDDKYYFANLADYTFSPRVVAEVGSSKRIQDGSYYVECSFYDEGAVGADKSYLQAYIILDKHTDEETNEISWELSRISHEAIFDSSGLMIKDGSGENELSYSIETKTVEAVTEDGVVYARYILEYPVFSGESKGEKVANQLFSGLAATYDTDTESVTEAYKKFIKKGGSKEDLPYTTYVVARVTYNRNGYISIVEGISEGKPQSDYKNAEVQEGEFRPVILPERTIEGYIIDVETGEFLSKNEIIDVEYTLVHKLLYRIYNGYEYESLLNENIASTEIVPEDTERMGKAFYESASAMGYGGYVFCYVNPDGYTESIVIPYDTDNFFKEDFSRKTAVIQ